MSQSNGALFQVSYAEALRQKLKQWADYAVRHGLKKRILQAYRRMNTTLKQNPLSGEPAYQLEHMSVTVFRLSFDFLTIYYAVDEKRHLVFVKDVLSSSNMELPESP